MRIFPRIAEDLHNSLGIEHKHQHPRGTVKPIEFDHRTQLCPGTATGLENLSSPFLLASLLTGDTL